MEQTAEYYDQTFYQYEHWKNHYKMSPIYPFWHRIVADIISRKLDGILDIGCGVGQFARCALDYGIQHYWGIDFSEARIAYARQRDNRGEFFAENIYDTKMFSDYPYLVVVATEILEHLERDREVLEKIRSGTRIYITVPNFDDPAHVRYFNTGAEAAARYGEFLEGMEMRWLKKGANMYYFLSGVKP